MKLRYENSAEAALAGVLRAVPARWPLQRRVSRYSPLMNRYCLWRAVDVGAGAGRSPERQARSGSARADRAMAFLARAQAPGARDC